MKWTVGTKIGAGYFLSLVIIIAIGLIGYINITSLIEDFRLVNHTNEILREADLLLALLIDEETGQRGFIITGDDQFLEPYNTSVNSVELEISDIRNLTSDNPNQQRRIDILESQISERTSYLNNTISLRREEKGYEKASQVVSTGMGKQMMDNIRNTIKDIIQEERNLLAVRSKQAEASVRKSTTTIFISILFSIVILVIVSTLITRNITKPLSQVVSISEQVASGNLTGDVSSDDRRDEVGTLLKSFDQMIVSLKEKADIAEQISTGNLRVDVKPSSDKDILGNALKNMVENLRKQMSEITESVNVLSSAASEFSASVTQLSSSTSETATSVNETTTTVEEVVQTAQISNKKAREISENAKKTAEVSESGRQATQETSDGMNRIREQMASITDSIMNLSEQSQAIGEIIATVDDIADQSNLLAVNAGIEAAKAGEQGKGFAVVAQEVKSLAEQSKQATTRVRAILNDVQKATGAAVMATEQGTKTVEAGVKQSIKAGESIRILGDNIVESAQAATQMAASNKQQMVGMEQVSGAMESIKLASTQNLESIKQMETTAYTLAEVGQKLKESSDRYKV